MSVQKTDDFVSRRFLALTDWRNNSTVEPSYQLACVCACLLIGVACSGIPKSVDSQNITFTTQWRRQTSDLSFELSFDKEKFEEGNSPRIIKAIIHNQLAFISLHYPYPSISPHIPPYSSSFHVERTRDLTPFRERQLKAMTTLPSVDKATKRCKKPSKKENGSMNAVDCCKNMYPRQWKRTNICTSLGQGKENKTSLEEQMENYWL